MAPGDEIAVRFAVRNGETRSVSNREILITDFRQTEKKKSLWQHVKTSYHAPYARVFLFSFGGFDVHERPA